MLILFDIDGTLLVTQGAGVRAMEDAGRELFGPHFTMEGIEFSGRLDVLIWNDLADLNRVERGDEHHETFRQAYGRHLTLRLHRDRTAKLLPGVEALVKRLSDDVDVTIGLLTGNYPETGRLKIQLAGLNPDMFQVTAWGCEAMRRRDLTPLAIDRHHKRTGRRLLHDRVIVIGDTPHDVDCAKAHGCRSIGVATGMFSVDVLTEAGADLAVPTLEDTDAILDWILQTPGCIPQS
jgi:phosphoglycolate phosphatase